MAGRLGAVEVGAADAAGWPKMLAAGACDVDEAAWVGWLGRDWKREGPLVAGAGCAGDCVVLAPVLDGKLKSDPLDGALFCD